MMAWLTGMSESGFLVLYWVLVAIAVTVAGLVPMLLPAPRPRTGRDDDLGPYELALLSGGPRRVVDTALADMLETGAAQVTAAETVRPGTVAPRDRMQRFVLSRICHNRRLTFGRDDLGVCHRGPGRRLVGRLLGLGYLTRRRAGARMHWLLVGVMAVGLLYVLTRPDLVPLANMAMVSGILLAMLGMMISGPNALEVRTPTGLAVQSRRQNRLITGLFLFMCAVNLLIGAPDGAARVLASVLGTGVLWGLVRAVLRRITAPVTTPRGHAVANNIKPGRSHTDPVPEEGVGRPGSTFEPANSLLNNAKESRTGLGS
jgi:uncharacterized protein (TIGR04222 family)